MGGGFQKTKRLGPRGEPSLPINSIGTPQTRFADSTGELRGLDDPDFTGVV